jgi:hypothetical protein
VNSPFPAYEALALVGKALQLGATFVSVHSASPSIVAFGLRAANGTLSIVAVNRGKSDTTPLVVKGATPTLSGAHVWSFDAAHPKLAKSTLHSSHYMLPGYGAALIRLSAAASGSHNR